MGSWAQVARGQVRQEEEQEEVGAQTRQPGTPRDTAENTVPHIPGETVENTVMGNIVRNTSSRTLPGTSAGGAGGVLGVSAGGSVLGESAVSGAHEDIAAKVREDCLIADDLDNSGDSLDTSITEGLNKRSREGSPILSKPEKKRKEDGNESDDTLTPSGEEDEGEREKAREGEEKKNDGRQ